MPGDRFDLRGLDLREIFPWLHLFRAFRMAIEPKKIALGAAGVLLTAVGWFAINWALGLEPPFVEASTTAAADGTAAAVDPQLQAKHEADSAQWRYKMDELRPWPWDRPGGAAAPDPFRTPLKASGWRGPGIPDSALLALDPIRRVVLPARLLFSGQSFALRGVLLIAWTLLVWAFFAGAITRVASVQMARDGEMTFFESLRFAGQHYFACLGAPVLPLVGVGIIILLCMLGGLLLWIPVLNLLAGVGWVLPLIAGFVMAVALLGLVLSWPLMYPAVTAEATQSYEAISRAYSFVLGRPAQFALYTIVALAFGGVLTTIATTVGHAMVGLSQFAVGWGGGEENLRQLYAHIPEAGDWRADFGPRPDDAGPAATTDLAARAVGFWTWLLLLAILGFAHSYFWSAATIIYFLLRREVDGTELDEVHLTEEEEEPFPTIAPTLEPPPAEQAVVAPKPAPMPRTGSSGANIAGTPGANASSSPSENIAGTPGADASGAPGGDGASTIPLRPMEGDVAP